MASTFSINLGALAPGSVTITKFTNGDITIKGLGDAAVTGTATTGLPVEVEAMVARHEANGHPGSRSRELAQSLIERGWVAKAGPKYLRFIFTGTEHKVTLYANSRDVMVREPRLIALAIKDAVEHKNEVRWQYVTDSQFDAALAAADVLTKYADAVMEPDGDDDVA